MVNTSQDNVVIDILRLCGDQMIAQLPNAQVKMTEFSELKAESPVDAALTKGLYGTTVVLGVLFLAYTAYMLSNFVFYKGF